MVKVTLNPGFRLVKILDIGYTTLIYFMLALIIAGLMDVFYGEYDEKVEKKKTVLRKSLDLIGMIWINGVIIYIVRNLAALIPSPFDGLYGFQHRRLKELDSAYVFDFVFMYNQTNLITRMKLLLKYIKGVVLRRLN